LAKKRKIDEGNVAVDLYTPDIPLTDQDPVDPVELLMALILQTLPSL
jgi:hypothetical protein